MTTEEYLQLYRRSDENIRLIQEYNAKLIDKYPFLKPRNRWSDDIEEPYDYHFTEMDAMPEGWRIAFGDQLLEELEAELEKFNYQNEYRIMQIKEKFGGLRWYDSGVPIGKLSDVIETVAFDDWKDAPKTDNENIWRLVNKEDNKYIYEHLKILEKCKVHDIINKYEILSEKTCIFCGKPAEVITTGWITPLCTECYKKHCDGEHYETVEEWFK